MRRPVVWKFAVPAGRNVSVPMPDRAHVLHVGLDREQDGLFVWALVEPDKPTVPHPFTVVGTGDELHPEVRASEHVGTVRYKAMVWHVFRGKW